MIAFIPARSGSKRVKNKNIIKIGGHPLIAYTVRYAKKVKSFDKVFCITDSKKYLNLAKKYGADDFILRPKNISGEKSSDIDWIKWAINTCKKKNIKLNNFAILRPTNPFRSKNFIERGIKAFKNKSVDSVRGIEKTKIHPGKIWKLKNNIITPILTKYLKGTPWHSCQYAALPTYYSQNASLEICRVSVIKKYGQFSGKKIFGLVSKGYDGFDINYMSDIIEAKEIIRKNKQIKKFLNLK